MVEEQSDFVDDNVNGFTDGDALLEIHLIWRSILIRKGKVTEVFFRGCSK